MNIVCSLFPLCSGCKHLEGVLQPPIWKEIAQGFPFDVELVHGSVTGWRTRAKLAVRGTVEHPKIGLFEEGSHTVVAMKTCPLHYPGMDQALDVLYRAIKKYRVVPYEESGKGRLRYLQMVSNREDGKIQLSLVFNGSSVHEEEFVKELAASQLFHSIWANFVEEKTNVIFGSHWQLLYGPEDFWQKMGEIRFCLHPACFTQAHLSLFDEILKAIEGLIPDGSPILDLYSGVGSIGLSLHNKCSKLYCIESSPLAKSCFDKTLASLGGDERCQFLPFSVEKTPWPQADVIIVDPPRKGLSVECKRKIGESTAQKLIYLSCGPHSFLRDLVHLQEMGWKLETGKGFLLFPGSDHVEILASFNSLG